MYYFLLNWKLNLQGSIHPSGQIKLVKDRLFILNKKSTVKFEDLIQSQETNLKKIVDFLDIEWSDDLLNYYQKNSGKTLAGGTRTDQPIKKKVIDNYLSTLTRDDQEKIANICMPLMETYGYSKG